MAVLGVGQNEASKEFISMKHTTQLPIVKSSCSKHEIPSFSPALPKRPTTTLLQSLKPFFRHSVTVQLLKDKSTADEKCFKFVRDYDGYVISSMNPKRLYRRYEQTISYNRINLTRRTFPYFNDLPSVERQSSPFKSLVPGSNAGTSSHFINFCTVENKVCERNEVENRTKLLVSPSTRKSVAKTVQFDSPSLSDLSDLTIIDDHWSTSPTDRVKITSLTRDRRTMCSRVRPSHDYDISPASPDGMGPQIIKITPRPKEQVVRRHVTKKESKRRSKSHVAFAPPPSPAMSKYQHQAPSYYGTYLKPKSVPFLD